MVLDRRNFLITTFKHFLSVWLGLDKLANLKFLSLNQIVQILKFYLFAWIAFFVWALVLLIELFGAVVVNIVV